MTFVLYLATAVAIVALAHRVMTPVGRAAAIVLLLLPLVFTGRALLTGRVYAPVELTYASQPLWSMRDELHVPEPHNRMLSDIAFQMIPWREALRRAVAAGEWPLLNRFEACGDPLAGAGQPAPFSPFTWLALLLPPAASFGFTASIAFLLAALGAFLLLRELGASELASIVAAIVFTFGTPIALQILWPLGFAWALLPLVLVSARRVVHQPSFRSASVLTAMLTLEAVSGHPETLLHVVAIGAVYGLFELAVARERGRAIAVSLAAGILALLLSAIAILPMLDATTQTSEHRVRSEWYARGPLRERPGATRAALLGDLLPFARASLGNPLVARAEAGSLALALAAFGLAASRRRERWFFGVATAVALLASADAPPVAQFLHRLPLFNVAFNDRLGAFVPLCLAVLTALAIDALSDRAAAPIVAVLVILAACAASMRPGSVDRLLFAAETVPLALAAIALLLPAASLSASLRDTLPARFVRGQTWSTFQRARSAQATHGAAAQTTRGAQLTLLALILIQRAVSAGSLVPANDARIAYPPVPLLSHIPRGGEPFRIVATGPALFPNIATMYGLEDARALTATTFTPFEETYPAWCRRSGFGFNQVDDLSRPFLSFLNVRYALTDVADAVPDGWRSVAADRGMRLVENLRVLPRAFVPRNVRVGVENDVEDMTAASDFADLAWIAAGGVPRDEPNGPGALSLRRRKLGFTIDATMQRAGWIVISQAAWRGWQATVDGAPTPLVRANHAFLAVHVAAGAHLVRLTYLPRAFVIGRAVTLGTLLLLALGAMLKLAGHMHEARF